VWLGLVVFTALIGALFASLLRPWTTASDDESAPERPMVVAVNDGRRL